MSLKSTKIPEIPALSAQTSSEVRRAFDAIRNFMRDLRGKGGVMSAQDLLDSAGSLVTQSSSSAPPWIPTPLAITNFTATGAFNAIVLQWTAPANAAHVEIWRNTANVLGTALFIGTTVATVVTDVPPDSSRAVTYYYWARAVNANGIVGPWNATAGTPASTANDPAYALQVLSENYGGSDAEKPMFVLTAPLTINGVTYPIGVYIKSAWIIDLTANNIRAGSISGDRFVAGVEITAPVINGGRINIGPFSIASNYSNVFFTHPVTGKTMLQVDSNGNAIFGGNLNAAGGTFSGNLAAGVIDGSSFDPIDVGPFTAAGTQYATVQYDPSWVNVRCKAIVIGAGGGGGGGFARGADNDNPASSGGGGGAGSLVIHDFAVTKGTQLTIYIGPGGSGGAPSVASGGVAGAGVAGASSYINYSGTKSASGGGGGGGGSSALAHSFLGGAGGSLGGNSGGGGYVIVFETGNGSAAGGNGGSTSYAAGGIGALAAGAAGQKGAGGAGGGAICYSNSEAVYSGGAGGHGYIMLQFYNPDAVVRNSRYIKLIEWLDTLGHGAVPTLAR